MKRTIRATQVNRLRLWLGGCVLLLCATLVFTSACNIDTRYHRCDPGDDCGRDDKDRVLFCACDGLCRAKCSATPSSDVEKCRAGESCVSGFCIHQDESDVKLGVKCENPNSAGVCAFGVTVCGQDGKIACRVEQSVRQEVCDDKDNDCDGKIDNDLARACTNVCGKGFERCAAGKWSACDAIKSRVCQSSNESCEDGIEECIGGKWTGLCKGEVKPEPETCDGKDNDCDGQIDEGTSQPCSNNCGKGQKLCVAGINTACNATNARACGSNAGTCVAGVQLCQEGVWETACNKSVGPSKEICDGKDNDCNGTIDDPWPKARQACELGKGECRVIGVFACGDDGASVACNAKAGTPAAETCNGKDDDCNGTVDDGIDKPCKNLCGDGLIRCIGGVYEVCNATTTRTCGPLVTPPCKQGAELCTKGKWTGVCQGQKAPQPELCDGADNDCDGEIDELWPGKGTSCGGQGVGVCPGTLVCKADGSDLTCAPSTRAPVPETCNGVDDDCDGKIDNVKPIVLSSHTSAVSGVAYHPAGTQLASSSIDGSVILWDLSKNPPVQQAKLAHGSPVYGVAYHPGGTLLATASQDKLVRLWNPVTGALVRTLTSHTGLVTRVAFGRFGQILLSASADNTVKVWLVSTGALLQTLRGHQAAVYGAGFGSHSSILASGGSDKKGLIWNLFRGTSTSFWSFNSNINALAFGTSGLNLYVGSSDNLIRQYFVVELDILGHRYQQALLQKTFTFHTGAVLGLAVHLTGRFFLSSSADDALALWDPTKSAPLRTLTGHTGDVRSVAFRPGAKEVASGSDDQKVHIWTCLPLP